MDIVFIIHPECIEKRVAALWSFLQQEVQKYMPFLIFIQADLNASAWGLPPPYYKNIALDHTSCTFELTYQ
jgi:hypothetical protein